MAIPNNPIVIDLGTPRAIKAVATRLTEKTLSLKSPPLPAHQLEEVIGRLDRQVWDDDRQKRRDLRRLPWVLTLGNPPLYKRSGYFGLLALLPGNLTGMKLKGLIFSCLMMSPDMGGRMESAASLAVESINTERDKVLKAGRKPSPFLQHWSDWRDALTPHGVAKLADKIVGGSLKDWQERLRIPSNSPRIVGWLKAVAKATCQKANEKIPDLLDSVQDSPSLEQKAVLLNELLLAKLASNTTEIDQTLASFSLRHFGDPRLDTKARWSGIAQEGVDLVSRWLSEEDLRLFFTYLGGDEKSERRQRYWSKYIEAGKVNYSRIFFSPADWQRLPLERRRDSEFKRRHGQFESTALSCSSAFVLGIEDYFVVEFLLTGNASYFYLRKDLPLAFLQRPKHTNQEVLKRPVHEERLLHQATDWESAFDETLSQYFSFPIPGRRKRYSGYRY